MGEPIGMITSILLFLIILCTALLSGSADALLENFTGICWIVLLVFAVLAMVQANRSIKYKANPASAFFSYIRLAASYIGCASYICFVSDIRLPPALEANII